MRFVLLVLVVVFLLFLWSLLAASSDEYVSDNDLWLRELNRRGED